MKFSDQFDVWCEVDGGLDGGVGGWLLTKLGRIEATPSNAAAAAFQHSSVCCWVRTSAQPSILLAPPLLKTLQRLLILSISIHFH